jgi:monoamine oxidase
MPRIPRIIKVLKSDLLPGNTNKLPRRTFVRQLSSLLLVGGAVPVLSHCRSRNSSQTTPKIAIIGAGMAGLTAAYHLEKAGLMAEIYEAQERVGGRIISQKGVVADGITTELGGEFIDSTHKDILTFCREFDLSLMDMKTPEEKKLVGTDYFFDGRRISEKEIIHAFNPFAGRLQRDVASLPESLNPQHPKVQELDHLSIDEYLRRVGISGWLFDLLSTSFTSELGLPSGDQSSLNLLVSMSTDTANGFEIYGNSDERYKVIGGNERIPVELRKRLKSELKTGYHLKRIATDNAGYKLSFGNGKEVIADLVIITLPFSVLRNVEIQVELPDRKRRCIQELGYGMQSKLFIGVNDRIWRKQGYSGYVLSDQIHNGWDSSQMQNGNAGPGGYSLFLGADKGKNLALSQYDSYLTECDRIFPGMKQAANGRKNIYNWNHNAMTRGAYACYKVGQLSEIGQAESQTIGNLYFAGEHCSDNFQGFMNGAAETGRKAAENMLKAIGKQKLQTVEK